MTGTIQVDRVGTVTPVSPPDLSAKGDGEDRPRRRSSEGKAESQPVGMAGLLQRIGQGMTDVLRVFRHAVRERDWEPAFQERTTGDIASKLSEMMKVGALCGVAVEMLERHFGMIHGETEAGVPTDGNTLRRMAIALDDLDFAEEFHTFHEDDEERLYTQEELYPVRLRRRSAADPRVCPFCGGGRVECQHESDKCLRGWVCFTCGGDVNRAKQELRKRRTLSPRVGGQLPPESSKSADPSPPPTKPHRNRSSKSASSSPLTPPREKPLKVRGRRGPSMTVQEEASRILQALSDAIEIFHGEFTVWRWEWTKLKNGDLQSERLYRDVETATNLCVALKDYLEPSYPSDNWRAGVEPHTHGAYLRNVADQFDEIDRICGLDRGFEDDHFRLYRKEELWPTWFRERALRTPRICPLCGCKRVRLLEDCGDKIRYGWSCTHCGGELRRAMAVLKKSRKLPPPVRQPKSRDGTRLSKNPPPSKCHTPPRITPAR